MALGILGARRARPTGVWVFDCSQITSLTPLWIRQGIFITFAHQLDTVDQDCRISSDKLIKTWSCAEMDEREDPFFFLRMRVQ